MNRKGQTGVIIFVFLILLIILALVIYFYFQKPQKQEGINITSKVVSEDLALPNYGKTQVSSETQVIREKRNKDNGGNIDLEKGLVLYYKFDNNLDDSADDYDGEETGSIAFDNGVLDKAAEFDGSNDKIQQSEINGELFTKDYSISLWFNLDGWEHVVDRNCGAERLCIGDLNQKTSQALVQKRGNVGSFILGISGMETFYPTQSCEIDDNYHKLGFMPGINLTNYCGKWLKYNDEIENNKWYHVVATYDSSNGESKLYVNGNLVDSEEFGRLKTETTTNLLIAGAPGNDTDWRNFDGKLDDLRIYDRVISKKEVNALYDLA